MLYNNPQPSVRITGALWVITHRRSCSRLRHLSIDRKLVIPVLIVLMKLGIAAIFGIVLGLEREIKHKPLGLKTCLVISVTSCLLTIVSIETAMRTNNLGADAYLRADPMRLAAQIVSGIGFLGAGVIMRRSNEMISGLTTAAIVWSASGLGIATGAGYYWQAAAGVILIFVSVEVVPSIMKRIGPKALREKEVQINLNVANAADVQVALEALRLLGISIDNVKIDGRQGTHAIELMCMAPADVSHIPDLYERIQKVEVIRGARIELM